jgi:hypothetical protein
MLRWNCDAQPDWFELLHERLARAIHENRSRAYDLLDRTRKSLRESIEEWGSKRGGGWYPDYDQVVSDVDAVIGFSNLSEEEAIFVLRAGLAAGYSRVVELGMEVARKHSVATRAILEEATQYEANRVVRRTACAALEAVSIAGRENLLLRMAIYDGSELVREAAGRSLAAPSDSESWKTLFGLSRDRATRVRSLLALARIHEATDQTHLGIFDEQLRKLSWPLRARFGATLAGIRFRDSGGLRILIVWLVAMTTTVVFTVLPRAMLAFFGLTFTQANTGMTGFFEGAFQGIVDAVTWSTFIGGAFLIWHFIAEGRRPWRAHQWPFIGSTAGFVDGIGISLAVLLAVSDHLKT